METAIVMILVSAAAGAVVWHIVRGVRRAARSGRTGAAPCMGCAGCSCGGPKRPDGGAP